MERVWKDCFNLDILILSAIPRSNYLHQKYWVWYGCAAESAHVFLGVFVCCMFLIHVFRLKFTIIRFFFLERIWNYQRPRGESKLYFNIYLNSSLIINEISTHLILKSFIIKLLSASSLNACCLIDGKYIPKHTPVYGSGGSTYIKTFLLVLAALVGLP